MALVGLRRCLVASLYYDDDVGIHRLVELLLSPFDSQ
jgi:hypothetical protein